MRLAVSQSNGPEPVINIKSLRFLVAGCLWLLAWATLIAQAILWLKHALWLDLDPLTAYAANVWPSRCWPMRATPEDLDLCRAMARDKLVQWAAEASLGLGTAKILVWLSDVWLGFYLLGLAFLAMPKD